MEFEDFTMMRLTPVSVVEFLQLVLRNTGTKASTISVHLGTVYVSSREGQDNDLKLSVGKTCISVDRSTHLRLNVGSSAAELAVFSGTARVESPSGVLVVRKQQTLAMNFNSNSQGVLVNKIEVRPYDKWEMNAAQFHERQFRKFDLRGWRTVR